MIVTLDCQGNGPVRSTKKNKFIRKVLVKNENGEIEMATVHANKVETLSGDGALKLKVRPATDFFFAVE